MGLDKFRRDALVYFRQTMMDSEARNKRNVTVRHGYDE
jgi:hypothetical protein